MKFSFLCATVRKIYIGIKGIQYFYFSKEVENANRMPAASFSYTNKIFLGSFDLKFSVTVPRAADQTDFEAPELDLTSFILLDKIV